MGAQGANKRPAGAKGSKNMSKKRKPDAPSAGHDKKRVKASEKPSQGAPSFRRKADGEEAQAKKGHLKKNFHLIQDAVQVYEKLRRKDTDPAEKVKFVSEIIEKAKGKLVELANNHTASRIIQQCAKDGSLKERQQILGEVRDNIIVLSKSKYGHHLVRKLINIATKDEIPGILRSFKGHVAELLRHPDGCDVVMDLYDVASTQQRNALCAELYGREFTLFDGVSAQSGNLSSLQQLLDVSEPSKRRSIIKHLAKGLLPVLEKGLLHPPMTHRLVREFLTHAPPSAIEDAVDTLSQTGGNVLKMVHTHDGAAAACLILCYGSAKDRKRLIKGMKEYVGQMASNEWGHIVLCCALSVVDDTAVMIKTILPEIKNNLQELVESSHGRQVLLQLLSPDNHRYFSPSTLAMLHPPQRVVKGSAGPSAALDDEDEDMDFGVDEADDDEELPKPKKKAGKAAKSQAKAVAEDEAGDDDEEAGTPDGERILGLSKKDPLLRRKELLGKGDKSLGAALIKLCSEQAGALLRSPAGCDVVVEVARGGDYGVLLDLDEAGVSKVHDAIASCIASGPKEQQPSEEAGPSPQQEHLFLHYYSSRALRRLILASAETGRSGSSASKCVEKMWSGALQGQLKQWVGSHADKVVGSLLHCGSVAVRQASAKELKPLLKEPVELWAQRFVKDETVKGKANKAKP